jgi:hypothetical protein
LIEILDNVGLAVRPLVAAVAVAVGLLLRLLVERNIVQWHFALSCYGAMDFDRNSPCFEERPHFVGWDYCSKIEAKIGSEPNAVQPSVGLVGSD